MEQTELLKMQEAYKLACEDWKAAIKEEEDLALVDPSTAQVDLWEGAHFKEEDVRGRAKLAKKHYEAALRKQLFQF